MQKTWATHFEVAGTARSRPGLILPSLLWPLRLCSAVLVAWLERLVSPQPKSAFANCRRRRKSVRSSPWAAPFQWVSSVAALLSRVRPFSRCQALIAKASAGDQWTSGRASGSDSASNGRPRIKLWPLSSAADSSIL